MPTPRVLAVVDPSLDLAAPPPPIPETWDDLQPRLGPEWTTCLAWAAGGGDPQGVELRIKGGRALYTAAWCVLKENVQYVRLARIEPGDGAGPKEVVRKVTPETLLDVRRPDPTVAL